jgi:Tol biopolymer transport system component
MLGAESTQLLQKPAMVPVWSPDGKWIAFGRSSSSFSNDRTSIWVMPRIGGAERKIAEINMDQYPDRFVSWSQDGKWLVSMDREDAKTAFHLVLVSVETGEKHKLTSPPEDILGDSGPALSPNGRTLAFTRNIVWGASDLWLLPLGKNLRLVGEPRKLTPNVPNANCPVWTPDGKEIVFCSRVWHRATLWRIRADGSRPAQPLPFAGRGAYLPDIARLGNRLVYTKHYWDTNIWRVELQSSGLPARAPEKFIQSTLNDSDAACSPMGQWIAFASERSGSLQIWICDAAGGSLRQITAMESTWGMEPKWSPDGQWIAFQADTEGVRKIYVVSFRGSKPRQLTFGRADDSDPHWSPDGNWIYFRSNRYGAYKVWMVSFQGGEPALTDGKILGQEASGGVGVYFVQEDSAGLSLWQETLNGGQASKILDGLAGPAIAVTRQGIYYTSPVPGKSFNVSLAFYSFANRKSTKVADVRPGTSSGTGLSVSPDGRYLLYTQCDEETDDLILVENFR